MNGTVKTVLIVGGVAVGVVILFKALAPSPALGAVPMRSQTTTDLISIAGLIGGAFGGTTYKNEGTYNPAASTFQVQGNQLINPTTGGAVVYGTD